MVSSRIRFTSRKEFAMRQAICTFLAAAGLLCAGLGGARAEDKGAKSVLDFKLKDIEGKEVALSSYKGKTLLFVNVASKCGLTEKQYGSLTKLHEKYKDKGFEILAFPANNFGKQEPGTDSEIKGFCEKKNVAFKLFSKISVKGEDIHPLYKFLTQKETDPKFAGDIRWNFDKFLVDKKGEVIARFAPKEDPLGKEVNEAIEKSIHEKPASK
jgi:glutathione peroxidase